MQGILGIEQMKAIVERLQNCSEEDVLFINGKAIVISPASKNDIERILSGRLYD